MVSTIASILISLILVGLFVVYPALTNDTPTKNDVPFYVGVTYCGNSATEAKLLVDKVKNYTHLFVLQSGALQEGHPATETIGDYAVANGLHFSAYLSVEQGDQSASWAVAAKQRWGDMFLGVYYGDEPGGKMLDSYVGLSPMDAEERITKLGNGGVNLAFQNGTSINYFIDGSIQMLEDVGDSLNGTLRIKTPNRIGEIYQNVPKPDVGVNYTYPNGTSISWKPLPELNLITYYPNGTFSSKNGKAQPYNTILACNPLENCDKAAQVFVRSFLV